MSHIVEVDQSIRLENSQKDSIFAFSDGIQYSVLIPRSVKRSCIQSMRLQGISGANFYIQFFVIALYYLLKNHIDRFDAVIIDREYTGKEGQIKDLLVNVLLRNGYAVDYRQIHFGTIGKHSGAHLLALSTLRKEEKPNLELTVKDILQQFKA